MKDALKVEIISLKARRRKAQDYCMNTDLMLECELLTAQIDALEQALKEED